MTDGIFCSQSTALLNKWKKYPTLEPQFNNLWYNDIPDITINNLLLAQQELQ